MSTELVALSDLARRINAEHEACLLAAADAVTHAIKAGGMLVEVKASLKHGEFMAWVEKNCRIGHTQACAYMKVANFHRTENLTSAESLNHALRMIADETAREDASREVISNGNGNLPGQSVMSFDDEPIVPTAIKTEVKASSKPTFNQTNDMVDWARWTWNPVTGCEHTCDYCYARDIANRFYPEKFAPTFRPERLEAPRNNRLPNGSQGLEWRNVFVCSMADLFGRWVPIEWIDGVFDSCRQSPEWNYLFLTKFPQRYEKLKFPETSWVGTSVDEQKRVANAEKAFRKINVPVKWLSVEPMLEAIKFNDLSMFDWVVIGGRSRNSTGPEFFPDPFWVIDLIQDAHKAGCKVYCKPNTDRHYKTEGSERDGAFSRLFQEYPDIFTARRLEAS